MLAGATISMGSGGVLDLFGLGHGSCTCDEEPPSLAATCSSDCGKCNYMSNVEQWMESQCSLVDPVRCLKNRNKVIL